MTRWPEPEYTDQVGEFYADQPDAIQKRIDAAVRALWQDGPNLRRPVVGEVITPLVPHLKELVISQSIRILFTFDPKGQPILLFAGDKAGQWNDWYPRAIDEAARQYADYLAETGQSP